MLNSLLPNQQSNSPGRFKLLRNFSIVSLAAFVLATGLLAIFYRQQAVYNLVNISEANNIALTQVFANTIWQKYASFLSSSQKLSNEDLLADPKS